MILLFFAGCEAKKNEPHASPPTQPPKQKPAQLYLPPDVTADSVVDLYDSSAHVNDSLSYGDVSRAKVSQGATGKCPPEMVYVANAFCIDRYEVVLVDAKTTRELSPHYPPSRDLTRQIFDLWQERAPKSNRALGRRLPVPEPPEFQLSTDFSPLAQATSGRIPAAYLSRELAKTACSQAGKRLCVLGEWLRACRGEQETKYPYGDAYDVAACNVHRESHPATLLHGDASKHHLDPRLGLAYDDDGPLLRQTGATETCVSRWGGDGIYDMVGNLDEWVDAPAPTFVGGFFSRGTKQGCDALIDSHAASYMDYSLGTRCCADAH